MYKKIFSWVLVVTFQPNRAWNIIANKEDKAEERGVDYKDDPFFANFLYPLIGLLTLASFLSVFTLKEFVLELALKNAIRTVVAYTGGFYLASYYIKKFCSKFVDIMCFLPLSAPLKAAERRAWLSASLPPDVK